jgi:hypothetical protein
LHRGRVVPLLSPAWLYRAWQVASASLGVAVEAGLSIFLVIYDAVALPRYLPLTSHLPLTQHHRGVLSHPLAVRYLVQVRVAAVLFPGRVRRRRQGAQVDAGQAAPRREYHDGRPPRGTLLARKTSHSPPSHPMGPHPRDALLTCGATAHVRSYGSRGALSPPTAWRALFSSLTAHPVHSPPTASVPSSR